MSPTKYVNPRSYVKSIKYGIIHYYAKCAICKWDKAVKLEEKNCFANVRNCIRKHVLETGHTVSLKSRKSTDYYLKEIGKQTIA